MPFALFVFGVLQFKEIGVGRNTRPAEGIAAESPAAFQQEAQEIASEYGDQFDDLAGWQKDAYQMYIDGNDDAESCII